MNFRDRISNKIAGWISDKALFLEAAIRKTGNANKLSGKLKKEGHLPMVFDLEGWRSAIASATDPENPDRGPLIDIYKSCELDDHLMSVIENRIVEIQGSKFKLVNAAGERDDEAVKLLKKPWMLDFIKFAMESIFFGAKLIEIGDFNDKLHVKEVNKIPEENINFTLKKVWQNAVDKNEGWQYDKTPLSNYYIQVGKDNELGVLAKLSVAVLFKKMATGSWLDYIEKYGVPPRWVITDREDDDRFEELYEMMKEMIGNHFAVLRGNEKIEIMPTPGTDAHQVFDKFIDRMDAGISKRIAGATGTVDEKAFVGAAKVHQETAEKRTFGDLLFMEYLINEELIPRLALISPIYSPLANLSFEWDDAEEMTIQEFIDNVSKLAKDFELNTEEITNRTGITIIKQKGNNSEEPTGGLGEKKPIKK
jgi:hypothetical protein